MSQVHRFRDCVAAHLGDGSTCYLYPHLAREIGSAMIEAAADIEAREFVNSEFRTREFLETGSGAYPHGYTFERVTRPFQPAPTGDALGDVLALLGDVSAFLVGFEDCDDNGELARGLLARIAAATACAPTGGEG